MPVEVTWDKKVYPSIAAAARAEGVPRSTMVEWLGRRGIGSIARPTTIRGVEYPTAKAAAEALGVSPQAVHNARRLGTLDNVGVKKHGRTG